MRQVLRSLLPLANSRFSTKVAVENPPHKSFLFYNLLKSPHEEISHTDFAHYLRKNEEHH